MVEHKVCKGCPHNEYPVCKGTIMFNGQKMNIENLKNSFQCGQKEEINIVDFTPKLFLIEELQAENIEKAEVIASLAERIKALEDSVNIK